MPARLACTAIAVVLSALTVLAQQPAPPAKPAPKPTPAPAAAPAQGETAKAAPEPPRQPVNVRIEVTIIDQRGSVPTVKKTITVVTGDGLNGRIRTQAEFVGLGAIPLNVDAMPFILPNGRIRLTLGLAYDLPVSPPGSVGGDSNNRLLKTGIQENLSVNLEDGKPLVVAQSADPVSDRQVTVEVRATILR